LCFLLAHQERREKKTKAPTIAPRELHITAAGDGSLAKIVAMGESALS
jgi:hypothetical protein